MIDDRKLKILHAIIRDYISTGEPVGSRTIAKKYNLGISPATVRNEMADLEEMGLLEQPHTSAGRIPSSKGYRLYVDRIMEVEKLSSEEEKVIRDQMLKNEYELNTLIHQASTLLSDLTKLTCIVNTKSLKRNFIISIQLIKVDNNGVLCIMVMDSGIIKNKLVKVSYVPGEEVLSNIGKVITNDLKELFIEQITLEVISSLKEKLKDYSDIIDALLPAIYEGLNSKSVEELFMEGTTNIFNYPEYNDIEKAKKMLSLLHNKIEMPKLIDSKDGITVRIGDENFTSEASDCAIISANYTLGGKELGTIALIGPKRINYSKVLSIMDMVMKELNETLNDE
ncbi:MAG: heat-inducible transcriptional repressor HrcA [Sarcina sp.]